MTSELLQRIKAAQLEARKSRDALTSSLLTTVIGESSMVGKSDGNRESTDAEVLQVLRKFEKNLLETITHAHISGREAHGDIAKAELDIIRSFMPSKISDEKVKDDIVCIMIANDLKYEQKSLGTIVKELKIKYGDQFDGQQVSSQFKSMI